MSALPELNRQTASEHPRYPERIVQFGAGNFLRAFVDWAIDILNEKADFQSSVVVVKVTPDGTYEELDRQDGLFHVHLEGIENGEQVSETRLVTCISRTVYPYHDFEAYLDLARQPDIRLIFSNTTEAGIQYDERDAFDDMPPASFPAKLTRFLYERWRHFQGEADKGCIVIPTELIIENGSQLRQMILQYAAQWGLEPAFSDWITQHNLFCNTLVDRIVSGFPRQQPEAYFKKIGYVDDLLVLGEPYHSWVIQAPDRLKQVLPFEDTGLRINVVSDIEPYRKTKVRILNGLHISMVALGLLLKLELVRDCVQHAGLSAFLHDLAYKETLPSLDLPPDELEAFARDTFDRFHNPSIDHRLASIAVNALSKVKVRLLPTLLSYQQAYGELPSRVVFVLAAFIRFYKGEWDGQALPLSDDEENIRWFDARWKQEESLDSLVKAVLTNTALWEDDLSQVSGLHEMLVSHLEQIEQGDLAPMLHQFNG